MRFWAGAAFRTEMLFNEETATDAADMVRGGKIVADLSSVDVRKCMVPPTRRGQSGDAEDGYWETAAR
jgi:hypothetical protein